MGLNKAIKSGKEKRKEYRRSKTFDSSCRNHGSCGYCEGNRTHFDKKARQAAEEEIEEYLEPGYLEEYADYHLETEKITEAMNEFFLSEYNEIPEAKTESVIKDE